jgi:hypothetical protein
MNQNHWALSRKTLLILISLLGVLLVSCEPSGGTPLTNNSSGQTADIEIGRLVSSTGLDTASCPIDTVSTFDRSDSIYIVADDSNVPAGTDIFARLSYEGQPVEDSVLISADQDYVDTCIYFEFEATSGAEVLDTGDYSAQLIVNGNPGPSVDFQVQ